MKVITSNPTQILCDCCSKQTSWRSPCLYGLCFLLSAFLTLILKLYSKYLCLNSTLLHKWTSFWNSFLCQSHQTFLGLPQGPQKSRGSSSGNSTSCPCFLKHEHNEHILWANIIMKYQSVEYNLRLERNATAVGEGDNYHCAFRVGRQFHKWGTGSLR